MENQKATLEPWLKEFEKRFIGYEKVSGGIGLSYVTDVDNPYLKNDISGIKDFIQETLSNREKEIAEKVEDSFWECPDHGKPEFEKTECKECLQCLDVNVILNDVLKILKH